MIIMSKFKKKISKSVKHLENAIVLGNGFNELDLILESFQTVFVFSYDPPTKKAKNLVYRENFNDVSPLFGVSVVFVDRDRLDDLEKLVDVWTKCQSAIMIEGNEVIDRSLSKILYSHGYHAVDQQSVFHTWKLKK